MMDAMTCQMSKMSNHKVHRMKESRLRNSLGDLSLILLRVQIQPCLNEVKPVWPCLPDLVTQSKQRISPRKAQQASSHYHNGIAICP